MGTEKLLPRETAKKAVSILKDSYKGAKYYLDFSNPLELLVAAILSAQTRDTVVNEVTPALFRKFKNVVDYSSSTPAELLKFIGRVTFAENKAKNIIEACRILKERYGSKVPDNMESLLSLPGVGRKTANTILINAYGVVEGIPVDTWVIKLSYRIGLSLSRKPDGIEKDLMGVIDKKDWKNIAYILKEHGHQICRAEPLCTKCPINSLCPKNGVSKYK